MRIGVLYIAAVLYVGLLYTAESCNVEIVVTSSPSNITSPGYPTRNYPNNLICWWKVVAANPNDNVVVEVVDSVIETSTNCTYDRLSFYDGFNTSAPNIGRICGTTRGGYISTGNSVFILFQTDSSNGYRGFLLKVYQTPKCGGELIATPNAKNLISPGYPDLYFNNMLCTWIITAENENDTIVLDVSVSHIEEQSSCDYDSVTVYNGNVTGSNANDLLGKYCGNVTPRFQSSRNQMKIVFSTDRSVVEAGFSLTYNSVEAGNCNLTMTVDNHGLYFVSPGFPNGISEDTKCVWIIVSTSLQRILLDVMTSEIEDSEECANDSVTVYSGFTTSDELGTFCGNNTPRYISDTYGMTIIFKTDDVADGKGFRIGYQSVQAPVITTTRVPVNCGPASLNATTYYQYLQSPGYPVAYQNNEQCIWTITASSSYMVKIVVMDSQLEQASNCEYDYVKVYDGRNTLANVIQIWCGDMTPTVQSSGRSMTLKFSTDTSNVFKGFRLKYFETNEPFTCGGSLSADSSGGILTSPGYPGNYQNNMDCVWTIRTFNTNIKINVLESNIESSSSCQYDYVKVTDGSSTSDSLLGKFCGTQTPTYYSSGAYVTIKFHSDNSNTFPGFKLEYTGGDFSPCSEQDLVAYMTTDYITSPNYPFNYPNNADCTWRIDTDDSDFVVSIDVITSSIEYSSDCSYDYVEAFDGYDEFSPSLGKWCGSDAPRKHSSGEYMFIKFKSDGSNTRTGFKISYTAKLQDSFPDLYPVNVAAIVGGTIGGVLFIAVVCILVAAANRKSSRPVVTRVQDSRAPGNIYTVTQGPYETTVTPASFQPPPPYTQVVTGEQRRIAGQTATPVGQAATQVRRTVVPAGQTVTAAVQTSAQAAQTATPPPYSQPGVTNDSAHLINQPQNS